MLKLKFMSILYCTYINNSWFSWWYLLTHSGRVTHICVSKLAITGSDNGLSPGRRQAIISTNAGILLIGPLGTNFSEILTQIHRFSFKKMHLKTLSAKWRPFWLGLNVLTIYKVLTYFLVGRGIPIGIWWARWHRKWRQWSAKPRGLHIACSRIYGHHSHTAALAPAKNDTISL